MQERPPALSFKIAKTYFDDNLSDQIDSFTLNEDGDFYERTIAQNDLTLEFSSETDGQPFHFYFKLTNQVFFIKNHSDIILSYSQAVTSNSFLLNEDIAIR